MPSCLTTCTGGERDDDDRGATTKGRRMLERQTWNQCEARARIIHRTRLSGQITFDLIRCFVTRWKMWTCLPRQVGCVSERTAALSLLAALGFHARIAGLEGPEHPRNEHFSFATASKLIKAKLQLWKKKKNSTWATEAAKFQYSKRQDEKGQAASVTGGTFLVQCKWSEKP